ncbi:MAG: C40 family peptidase [Bacteroidales bacterium]|nr:C40 family peptidase [Bacteroidales bacterium]
MQHPIDVAFFLINLLVYSISDFLKVMNQYRFILLLLLFLGETICIQAQEIDSIIVSTITEDFQKDSITAEFHEPEYKIDTLASFIVPTTDSLICYAESLLGTPYQYGEKGPDKFDCSGFTGFVFKHFGILLPSSSTYQYKEAPIKTEIIDSAKQGDLIFFMGRNGRKSVGHVGIVVDVDTATHSCRFIHAATHGGVILTNFPSSAYYNQRFMGFGRFEIPEFIYYYQTRKVYLEETIEYNSEGE